MEINFNVTFENAQEMDVQFTEDSFNCEFEGVRPSDYSGTYTVTPSDQQQILQTASRTLEDNIVIEPIPNNYGLITWDGSTITVS